MTRQTVKLYTAISVCGLMAVFFSLVSVNSAFANTFSIVNNSGLTFGKFVPGTGGTVVINASTGLRSATGGVTLMTSSNQPAQFTVSCVVDGGASACTSTSGYTISAVPGTTLTSGGNNMSLTGITVYSVNNSSNTAGLLAGGTDTLKAGATLTVGNNQAPGSYSGTFSLTVTFP